MSDQWPGAHTHSLAFTVTALKGLDVFHILNCSERQSVHLIRLMMMMVTVTVMGMGMRWQAAAGFCLSTV